MSTAELIFAKAQSLPATAQEAVLQIVELLAEKTPSDDEDWSRFSLNSAMRGLENEDWPDFTQMKGFERWP